MLAVDDIKKLTQVFVTKQDLQDLREEMATKKEMRQVVTLLDKIAGELKGIRDDRVLQNRINDRVEQRLNSLEPSKR